jgi:P pilus assembly chaperone PapD
MNSSQNQHRRAPWSAPVSLWASCVAAMLTLSVSAGVARAQLTVEQLELVLSPRSAPVATFGVRNDGDRVVQASLDFEDWDRAASGENRFYPVGTGPGSCGRMLRVFPTTLRLEPGQTRSVRVDLVDADTLSAACWSVVFVENREPPSSAQRQITYSIRTGVKIYVEPPNLLREGYVENMALVRHIEGTGISARESDNPSLKDVAVTFRNAGGLQVRVKGSIEMRRPDNSVAHEIQLSDIPVLPGAERVVRMKIPDTLPAGRYVILALLDYGGSELAAGQLEYEVH